MSAPPQSDSHQWPQASRQSASPILAENCRMCDICQVAAVGAAVVTRSPGQLFLGRERSATAEWSAVCGGVTLPKGGCRRASACLTALMNHQITG